jgi:hypothetical protein
MVILEAENKVGLRATNEKAQEERKTKNSYTGKEEVLSAIVVQENQDYPIINRDISIDTYQ